ncbi:histidine phosphatase family protein [Actinoplanes sp. CA-054009]
MRNVYVVTHPEATHHLDKVVGGWHDSRLTAGGLAAASDIAAALLSAVPEGATVALSSSDLRRTRETAEVIGRAFGVEPRRAPSGSITTLREDDYLHNRQVVALGAQPSNRRTTDRTGSGEGLR